MNSEIQQKYGLFTTISLVVGIVIGSGIFFKTDDVLAMNNGNIGNTLLAFLLVGTGVIFGALVISRYAIQNSNEGGIISYSSQLLGHKYGFIVGWFMVSVYFPALVVVLAQVTAQYTAILLGISGTTTIFILSIIYLAFAYTINIFSVKISSFIQDSTTILKLIPIVLIALLGLLLLFTGDNSTSQTTASIVNGDGFLSSLVLIAFVFDGWIVATSISAEVKNSKKNLPKALIVGTIIILIAYLLYVFGATQILEPKYIISAGDSYIDEIGRQIFGNSGAKVITLFVVISVYGGLHGMVLSIFRLPHALVKDNLMKDVFSISKINSKYNLSFGSILFTLPFIIFYIIIQLITANENSVLHSMGFDISSLPVIINYIFYTILFLGVIKFIKEGIVSKIYYLYIFIASLVSILVLYGSMSENGILYILLSIIAIALGTFLYPKKQNV